MNRRDFFSHVGALAAITVASAAPLAVGISLARAKRRHVCIDPAPGRDRMVTIDYAIDSFDHPNCRCVLIDIENVYVDGRRVR